MPAQFFSLTPSWHPKTSGARLSILFFFDGSSDVSRRAAMQCHCHCHFASDEHRTVE